MTRLPAALRAAAALPALACLTLAAPASAASAGLADPSGDAAQGLDVTHVRVANGAHAVTARVRVAALRHSTLIVSVDRRGGSGLRLVSEYRPGRSARSSVVTGAFTDPDVAASPVACAGFRVSWDTESRSATLRLPAHCWDRGRYGAIRFALLTEESGGGADADYAPQTRTGDLGNSAWIRRG